MNHIPKATKAVGLAAAVVALLGVAGCGSSSSSSSSSAKPAITKTAFLAKGNAICAKGNAQQNAESAALGAKPSQAQLTNLVQTKLVPSIQSQINAIRALGAPAGDEAKVTMMMDVAQADLDKVKKDPSLITSNSLFNNFSAIAHPYGLTQCASGS